MPLTDTKQGTPISIRGEINNGKFDIYNISQRSVGTLWDIFNIEIALINHVNKEKNMLSMIVNKGVSAVICDNKTEKYKVGDCLEVYLCEKQYDKNEYIVADYKPTAQKPSRDVLTEFSSAINHISDAGHGFITDNI